jgi:hypothetical protein
VPGLSLIGDYRKLRIVSHEIAPADRLPHPNAGGEGETPLGPNTRQRPS